MWQWFLEDRTAAFRVQKVAGNCRPSRAKYLLSFAKFAGKTAEFRRKISKRLVIMLFGDDIMVFDIWMIF